MHGLGVLNCCRALLLFSLHWVARVEDRVGGYLSFVMGWMKLKADMGIVWSLCEDCME